VLKCFVNETATAAPPPYSLPEYSPRQQPPPYKSQTSYTQNWVILTSRLLSISRTLHAYVMTMHLHQKCDASCIIIRSESQQ